MFSKTIAMASVAGLALVLSGCSSQTTNSGIANLGNAKAGPTAAAKPKGSAEDQAIAFAQCMRDNGVDFPDPTVDAQGNPSFANAFKQSQSGGFKPGDTSFRTAMTACQSLASGLQIGGGGGNFDSQAMTDALYSYTQCLRDQGLDVGDITLGSGRPGGGGAPGAGGTTSGGTSSGSNAAPPSAAPGDGQAPAGVRGGGFNNTDRFATQLGQDPTSPAWIAANKVCQPVLTKAMTSARGGAAGSTATAPSGTGTGA
ncbi:hypothetical protein [Demequina lutea]|uniref:Uncharacterized protein n=1 Tax=Demequina lutea TaxID=431489 RepID=A0A7Y9Z758_9MICO|nr:hypothetical protein [Demequina lutea]NYI40059.1 hypothetical protein [Demequina lutea]